jgi:hypothetical protein
MKLSWTLLSLIEGTIFQSMVQCWHLKESFHKSPTTSVIYICISKADSCSHIIAADVGSASDTGHLFCDGG